LEVAVSLWLRVRATDLRLELSDIRAVKARGGARGFDLDLDLVGANGEAIRELYARFRDVDTEFIVAEILRESARAIDRFCAGAGGGPDAGGPPEEAPALDPVANGAGANGRAGPPAAAGLTPGPDPVGRALELISDSPRSVALVRYLAGRDGHKASLKRIAEDLDHARPATAARRAGTIRKRFQRARRRLDETHAPIMLEIDRGAITLVIPEPTPGRDAGWDTRGDTDVP
jgi:hypothetical protein